VFLDREEIEDMIAEADQDKSGAVSEGAFLQILKLFWYF